MSSSISSILANSTFYDEEQSLFSNCAQHQEVNDLMAITKLEGEKYLKYKSISDTLLEFLRTDDNVEAELKEKVNDVVLSHMTSQTLKLRPEIAVEHNFNLLGIPSVESEKLNYLEGNKLLEIIEKRLKGANFNFKTYEEAPSSFFSLDKEDQHALDHRNKLLTEQKLYIKNLSNLKNLLEEMTEIRIKQVPEIVQQNLKQYEDKLKINYLKSEIVKQKLHKDIYKETDLSFQAYSALFQDIRSEMKKCEREILDLQDLKKKYDEVACKEFDEILSTYIKRKALIEMKKSLH